MRNSRVLAPVCLLAVALATPGPVFAQDGALKAPTIAASVAAAADWASTYHALKNYHVRETNILLRRFDDSPGKMVSLGAAMDAGIFSAWNVTVGRSHPRAAAVGLWAIAAFRGYLALHNLRNERKAERR